MPVILHNNPSQSSDCLVGLVRYSQRIVNEGGASTHGSAASRQWFVTSGRVRILADDGTAQQGVTACSPIQRARVAGRRSTALKRRRTPSARRCTLALRWARLACLRSQPEPTHAARLAGVRRSSDGARLDHRARFRGAETAPTDSCERLVHQVPLGVVHKVGRVALSIYGMDKAGQQLEKVWGQPPGLGARRRRQGPAAKGPPQRKPQASPEPRELLRGEARMTTMNDMGRQFAGRSTATTNAEEDRPRSWYAWDGVCSRTSKGPPGKSRRLDEGEPLRRRLRPEQAGTERASGSEARFAAMEFADLVTGWVMDDSASVGQQHAAGACDDRHGARLHRSILTRSIRSTRSKTRRRRRTKLGDAELFPVRPNPSPARRARPPSQPSPSVAGVVVWPTMMGSGSTSPTMAATMPRTMARNTNNPSMNQGSRR